MDIISPLIIVVLFYRIKLGDERKFGILAFDIPK